MIRYDIIAVAAIIVLMQQAEASVVPLTIAYVSLAVLLLTAAVSTWRKARQ